MGQLKFSAVCFAALSLILICQIIGSDANPLRSSKTTRKSSNSVTWKTKARIPSNNIRKKPLVTKPQVTKRSKSSVNPNPPSYHPWSLPVNGPANHPTNRPSTRPANRPPPHRQNHWSNPANFNFDNPHHYNPNSHPRNVMPHPRYSIPIQKPKLDDINGFLESGALKWNINPSSIGDFVDKMSSVNLPNPNSNANNNFGYDNSLVPTHSIMKPKSKVHPVNKIMKEVAKVKDSKENLIVSAKIRDFLAQDLQVNRSRIQVGDELPNASKNVLLHTFPVTISGAKRQQCTATVTKESGQVSDDIQTTCDNEISNSNSGNLDQLDRDDVDQSGVIDDGGSQQNGDDVVQAGVIDDDGSQQNGDDVDQGGEPDVDVNVDDQN